jgi:hypothetical protein
LFYLQTNATSKSEGYYKAKNKDSTKQHKHHHGLKKKQPNDKKQKETI